ncbi:hypothetical protein NQ318_011011, partial [Aromia moschata]
MRNDQSDLHNRTIPSTQSTGLATRFAELNLSPARADDTLLWERARYADPGRWNLKYDGVSSVNNFLDRVEELRKSRGVSKPQLLRSAAELFTRDALLWFRTNQFSSWDDLVAQLRDAFQPYDYENGIWEELRRRTQGVQERVVIFIASMEQLFNRLAEKPSEEARVRLIRRNLLPYIQTQLSLRTITSVRELVQACRAIEETEIRVQRFCPPPTNYRQLLEPELAYHKPSVAHPPSISTVISDSSETIPPNIAEVSHTVTNSELRVATCWNCRNTGHRFRQCGQPRRIFCFKCGHDNLYKKLKNGSAVDRLSDPKDELDNSVECKIILDYVFAHAKEDKRPYLNVTIYGRSFLGLLDSGCTTTVLGASGWKILKGLCNLNTEDIRTCTVANGQICESIGHVRLPIHLCSRVKIIKVLVMPSIPHELILGVDFWRTMGIIPDLFANVWSFRSEHDSVNHEIVAIHPMDSLTAEQRERLIKVVDASFAKMGDKLGCTDL